MSLSVPVASDPPELVADWLELQAFHSPNQSASLESLVRLLRRGGTVDGLAGDDDDDDDDRLADRGSATTQEVGQDAFAELEVRGRACDGEYPFEIDQGLVRLKAVKSDSPYLLLLLLSF